MRLNAYARIDMSQARLSVGHRRSARSSRSVSGQTAKSLAGERLGLGRLPGDFLIERGNVKIYIPLMTSLIVSVVLSLLFWFFGR